MRAQRKWPQYAQQDLIQFSEGVLTSLDSLPAAAMAEPAVATPGEQAVQIHEPTAATAPATPAGPAPSLDVQA